MLISNKKNYVATYLYQEFIIGVSLSEPHTSESSGTSVMFTKIYEVIWINGSVCKHLCLKTDKNQITYKCFRHVHSLYKELQC